MTGSALKSLNLNKHTVRNTSWPSSPFLLTHTYTHTHTFKMLKVSQENYKACPRIAYHLSLSCIYLLFYLILELTRFISLKCYSVYISFLLPSPTQVPISTSTAPYSILLLSSLRLAYLFLLIYTSAHFTLFGLGLSLLKFYSNFPTKRQSL